MYSNIVLFFAAYLHGTLCQIIILTQNCIEIFKVKLILVNFYMEHYKRELPHVFSLLVLLCTNVLLIFVPITDYNCYYKLLI